MMVQAVGNEVIGPNGKLIPIGPAVRFGSGLILQSGQTDLRNGKIVGQTIEEQTEVEIDNVADVSGFNVAYARRFFQPFPARDRQSYRNC